MLKEFKEFAMKGNVVDMAVGIIIGAAFGKIVSSLVADVIMPPIGMLMGRVNFADLYFPLSGTFESLAQAKATGAPTINYGLFLNTVIDFVIVAFVIFMIVKQMNRLKKPAAPAAPTTRDCTYCLMAIPLKATKCGHCASDVKAA